MLAFSRDCWQAGITPRLPQYGFTRNTETKKWGEESVGIEHDRPFNEILLLLQRIFCNNTRILFSMKYLSEKNHTRGKKTWQKTSLSWHAQAYLYLYIVRALYLHTRLEQSDKSFHNFSERTKHGKGSNYVCQGGSSNTFWRCTIK